MTGRPLPGAGLRRPALQLLWAVPVAVLFSIPLAALAGLAWGAIGGCSPAFLGVDPEHLGLALGSCAGAALVLMLPGLIIPWTPHRLIRVVVAVATGLLYGVVVAVITHSQCPWLV